MNMAIVQAQLEHTTALEAALCRLVALPRDARGLTVRLVANPLSSLDVKHELVQMCNLYDGKGVFADVAGERAFLQNLHLVLEARLEHIKAGNP